MCKYVADTSEFVDFYFFLTLRRLHYSSFYSQCDSVSSRHRVSSLCGLLPSVPHPPPPNTHTFTQIPCGRRLPSTPLFLCHSPPSSRPRLTAIWLFTHAHTRTHTHPPTKPEQYPHPTPPREEGVTWIKGQDQGLNRIRYEFGRNDVSIKGTFWILGEICFVSFIAVH